MVTPPVSIVKVAPKIIPIIGGYVLKTSNFYGKIVNRILVVLNLCAGVDRAILSKKRVLKKDDNNITVLSHYTLAEPSTMLRALSAWLSIPVTSTRRVWVKITRAWLPRILPLAPQSTNEPRE